MGVPVVRHPEGTIRLGMYTQYTLIYHDALDMPTPECEQQWREFEKRFYENACKDGNAARPEDKVFVERATLELIPDTDRLSWAIGSRYTVVLITEEELQWLQVNGICQLYAVEEDWFIENAFHEDKWGLWRISHVSRLPITSTKATEYLQDNDAGNGITVFVVDTGVDSTVRQPDGQPEFRRGVSASPDFSPDNNLPVTSRDGNGHGTFVAGIIASTSFGVAKAARIADVKVLGNNGRGDWRGVRAGLQWIKRQIECNKHTPEHMVVNLSIGTVGGPSGALALDKVLKGITDAGVIVVCSAGNNGKDIDLPENWSWPCTVSEAICVGATDKNDRMAVWGATTKRYRRTGVASPCTGGSNYGNRVDIWAPGKDIWSTVPAHKAPKGVMMMSGTSMAAPYVSGQVAVDLAKAGLKDQLGPLSATAYKHYLLSSRVNPSTLIDIRGRTGDRRLL